MATDVMTPAHDEPPQGPPVVAPPPGHPRFPHLDGVRGLALLTVIAYHVPLVLGDLDRDGWPALLVRDLRFAPPVFFVLSGFLLYRPFVAGRSGTARPPRIREYFGRRLLRILPAYYVALTVAGSVPILVQSNPEQARIMDAPLRYYGFLQIYSTSTWRTGLAHAWTVCVEMVFYLLLPLIAVLGARMWATSRKVTGELAILLAIGVLSVMLRAWVFATPDRLAADFWMVVSPLCTVAYFAAGMALALASVGPPGIARLRRVLERLARRPALCWGVAAAIYVAGARYRSLFPLPGASEYLEFLAVALLLVLPAAFPHALEGGLHRFLRWRPVALLGVISYGVYLWHGPMLSLFYARGVLDGWDVSRHAWSLGLLVLASSLLAGALSYVIVERPALAYKHRRRPASADAMSPPVDLERRA